MRDWYWLKPLLALMIVSSFILLLNVLLVKPVPSDNNDAVMLLLGGMLGIVRDIYSYFFGASENKERKHEIPVAATVGPDVVAE